MSQQSHNSNTSSNAIALWLYGCAFMVLAMAIIGAITRLTESGLSMVEWRPLLGALPPLNEAEWNRVYEMYKQSPEFEHKHFWMSLHDFKQIFFWEWFHRLWGRLIGLAFLLPLLYFWLSKRIPQGWKLKLIGLFFLGGAQGLMGWIMVKSGLVDRPSVSHFRLAAHLSLAALIFGALILSARAISKPQSDDYHFDKLGLAALGCVFITLIWGAFVAGLDAGLVYNHFPKMTPDHWLPPEADIDPLNNHGWVQFTHRVLALISFFVVGAYTHMRKAHAVGAALLIQIGLGIATLLSAVMIPIAALHQAGAFILIATLILSLYRSKKR
ncbi:MAG: COX15/CtaA family protein [Pseudomonadota bacterium]|nr:heme A synthase [Alphaproteobacteria bacterium]MEC7701618.1 COX15/CtaA family protein [Pseudomonadota bacterium]MEC9235013.1 COX15/CtaA family protein [Pseudomonadota bacterium]MEE3323472.1 COX15/CtaA family protein [Pseudomonadota bacterium]|tara:strand:+ start:613362 stop:614342 length:981 start_codon:yes stop_codon:yes gene_type:complete